MEKQVILPFEQYEAIMKALDTNLKENVVYFTREEHGQQNVYLNYILSKDEMVKELTEELDEIKPRYEECIKHNTKLLEEELLWEERLEAVTEQKNYFKYMYEEIQQRRMGKHIELEQRADQYRDRWKVANDGWEQANKKLAKATTIKFWLSVAVVGLVAFIIIAMINQAQ